MKKTDVTYGQLDKVLRSLGFACRQANGEPAALRYEHKSGALISLPPLPKTDSVLEHHLVGVRTTLELFGIADSTLFAAKIQKAG